jgi:hypothetical protein
MNDLRVIPLPSGEPDLASPLAVRRVSGGGDPCRRCLRRTEPGEPVLLVPYDPFTVASPYSGLGPVFVHADGCEPPRTPELAPLLGAGPLSLRAYDRRAMLVDAEVIEVAAFDERAQALLAAEAAFVHVHFARPGCFAVRLESR